jgi:hypothetical protein
MAADTPPLDLLTADQILTAAWTEPAWVIPGLLPVGLTILAGRPKVGKSWLALQVALAVASGGRVLGRRAQQGPVLYLALEDSPRRLKQRMVRQGWTPGLPADFMPLGQFSRQIGDLRAGGAERLAAQIDRVGYRLVVVDTLSRSCPGDQNDAEQMTRALEPLQEMAHLKNCVVFVSDHHRKMSGAGPDAVRDILGSTAKGAMADSIWGLYADGGKKGARLVVVGRDVEERTLALSMDWLTGCWQYDGPAGALQLTQRRQEILDALKTLGPARLNEIAAAVGQPKSNTHRRLQDLANAGLILRHQQGREVSYALP